MLPLPFCMEGTIGSYQLFVESDWQVAWVAILSELPDKSWENLNTEEPPVRAVGVRGSPFCTTPKRSLLLKHKKTLILRQAHRKGIILQLMKLPFFFLLYIMWQVFNKYIISFMANNNLTRCVLVDPSYKHGNWDSEVTQLNLYTVTIFNWCLKLGPVDSYFWVHSSIPLASLPSSTRRTQRPASWRRLEIASLGRWWNWEVPKYTWD